MVFKNALRSVVSTEMTLAAPVERVFPLLCPVREYDWIDGWSCDMVYSQSGVAELGCIFRTNSGLGDEVWTTSRYEPGRAIEFVRVLPNVWVVKLDIALRPKENGTTLLHWTFTHTALSEAGAMLVAAKQEEHRAMLCRIEKILTHYVATGTMLRSDAR